MGKFEKDYLSVAVVLYGMFMHSVSFPVKF